MSGNGKGKASERAEIESVARGHDADLVGRALFVAAVGLAHGIDPAGDVLEFRKFSRFHGGYWGRTPA